MTKKTSLLASVTSSAAKMSYVPNQDDSVLRQIAIGKIQPRIDSDIRGLRPRHVVDLAATICAAGLLQPIAVDSRSRLVAGKHRLAAFKLLSGLKACADLEARKKLFDQIVEVEGAGDKLSEELEALNPNAFEEHHPGGVIPCRLMPFDSEKEPAKALAGEGIENFERENFTSAEVRKIATKLQNFGYVQTSGRPSATQKPLNPALAMIVGKSLRQVRRMLAEPDPVSAESVSALPALLRALEKAMPELQAARNGPLKSATQHFRKGLGELKSYLSSQE